MIFWNAFAQIVRRIEKRYTLLKDILWWVTKDLTMKFLTAALLLLAVPLAEGANANRFNAFQGKIKNVRSEKPQILGYLDIVGQTIPYTLALTKLAIACEDTTRRTYILNTFAVACLKRSAVAAPRRPSCDVQ